MNLSKNLIRDSDSCKMMRYFNFDLFRYSTTKVVNTYFYVKITEC
jgi:hypothetical protein